MSIDIVYVSGERDYRYVLTEDTYVVWLARANRFLHLKEPAFLIFEAWTRGKDTDEIALECAGRYGLPMDEAVRFTNEIIDETEKLYGIGHGAWSIEHGAQGTGLRAQPARLDDFSRPPVPVRTGSGGSTGHDRTLVHSFIRNSVSNYTCIIHGKTIRFIYAEPELEELFRPMFRQFEVKSDEQRAKSKGQRASPAIRFNERNLNFDNYKSLRRREMFIEKDTPPAPEPWIEMLRQDKNLTPGGQDGMKEAQPARLNDVGRPPVPERTGSGGDSELRAESETRFHFFLVNDNYAFRVDDQETQTFKANDTEHFQGAVLLELLNILHGKTRDEWMGVFHASAVSDGKEALLFVAGSGSGKSTLAALMVASGFQLLSDDFVPVALETPEVFPLPAAISVKKSAIPFLKDYFPSLSDEKGGVPEDADREVFLPLPGGSITASAVTAKAIVFVQYDPAIDFRLTRESNLTAMNSLLEQSWIASNPAAAETFLAWYFSLPVYSLVYSDSERVVRELRERL